VSGRGASSSPARYDRRVEYDEALRWLAGLPDFERSGEFSDRPDLAPMRALLAALGDPHLGRPTLHVAGSKGKGSTCAMAERVLHAAGRRTGFYSSPHLHRYNERIRIDGEPLAPGRFGAALATVREAMARVEAQFPGRTLIAFDALTAAAFLAFREAGVDAQVVEVGLGGALDSTNVFHDAPHRAHVVAITPISLEHTAILGRTIPEIAAQKAGIITRGCVAVAAPQRESALDVIRERARAQDAALLEVAATCQMARGRVSAEDQEFKLRTARATYAARLPLSGRHQLDNAATAVMACEGLAQRAGFALAPAHVRDGLAGVRWPARMEVLQRRPLVVVDGAHNGDSAKRMVEALREYVGVSQAVMLFGTLVDKDAGAMAAAVAPVARTVYVSGFPSRRAADVRAVASAFAGGDAAVFTFGSLPQACDAALADAGPGGCVLAFGALAFAAAVREYILGIESDMIRVASAAAREAAQTRGGEAAPGQTHGQ